jgi:hypothetical protein
MLAYPRLTETTLASAVRQEIPIACRHNWLRNDSYKRHSTEDLIILMQARSATLSSPILFSGSKFFSYLNTGIGVNER